MKLISIVIPFKFMENKIYFWNQNRSENNLLEFPGGKIEKNEIPVQAAKREVQEETKVILAEEELSLFKIYDFKDNLRIYTFLYEDKNGSFLESGYKESSFFKEKIELIMPNNQIIFSDLVTYLQPLMDDLET